MLVVAVIGGGDVGTATKGRLRNTGSVGKVIHHHHQGDGGRKGGKEETNGMDIHPHDSLRLSLIWMGL